MTDTLPVTFTVEADFDRDGSYETDLTDYVTALRSGTMLINRAFTSELKPSELQIRLDNISGIFSPLNSSGSLYGQLGAHVPIRVTADHNSVSYTLWSGYTQRWVNDFGGPGQAVTVQCRDIAEYLFENEPVNVLADTSRDTDGALIAIMDALSLASGDRNFDDGVQALPMHFVVGQEAGPAMLDVVDSEMGGRLFVQADGELRFEARSTRLGHTADATWGDGTNIQCENPQLIIDPQDLVTGIRARATVFRSGQADTPIFEFSQNMFTKPSATSMALAAGEVYQRTFQANSAYLALTTPDDVYDYTANSAIDGTGTDKTAQLGVTVTDLGGGRFTLKLVNNDASMIYVTKFRLRGQPVEFFADRPEATFSLSVPGMKAGKTLEIDIPFGGDSGGTMRDYAYGLMRTWRYVVPVVVAPFAWDHDDTIAAMLGAELGDLVQFADLAPAGNAAWATGADDLYYVESIRHELQFGAICKTTVTLVPSYVYRDTDHCAFDTFDRSNASGDLGTTFNGKTWANDTGFDIASNAARANTDTLSVPDVTLGVDDQVVEVQLANIGTGDEVGVVLRKTDASNYYRAYVDKGSNEVILEKVVATVVTELASPAFTVGSSHEIRAMVQGDRLRVWVDFVQYIDETDSALTTGTKCGLMARNASGTTTFENFYGQGL